MGFVFNPLTAQLDLVGDDVSQEKFFYDLIDMLETVVIETNRLLLYKDHITVLGHLTVNGRLAPV